MWNIIRTVVDALHEVDLSHIVSDSGGQGKC